MLTKVTVCPGLEIYSTPVVSYYFVSDDVSVYEGKRVNICASSDVLKLLLQTGM